MLWVWEKICGRLPYWAWFWSVPVCTTLIFILLTISKGPYGNMRMRRLNSTRACWSSGVPLQGLSWGMMMHIWKIYAPCLRGQGWSRQRGGPHRTCHWMTLRMSANQTQTTLLWWIPLLVCFKCVCLCVLTLIFQFSPLNMLLKRKMSLMKNSLTGGDHRHLLGLPRGLRCSPARKEKVWCLIL